MHSEVGSSTGQWVGALPLSIYLPLIPSVGFPLDFFPVLFAVPRVVGWLAHWRQARLHMFWGRGKADNAFQMMLQEGGVKIWRPRQACLGTPSLR